MCGLFGFYDYKNSLTAKQKSKLTNALAQACEARGTDAAGIAYNSGGRLHIYKRALAAHLMRFKIPVDSLAVIGHTRLTTQGNAKHNYNNHPFRGTANQAFALTHNGVLYNDMALRRNLQLPNTKIETDSFVAVQMIEQQRHLDFTSLRCIAEQLEGTFSFAVLDEQNRLYLVKGNNPLCLYHYPASGLYVYASTEDLLQTALQKTVGAWGKPQNIMLDDGDMLRLEPDGQVEREYFSTANLLYEYRFLYGGTGWGSYTTAGDVDKQYLREIKSVAAGFGIEPEDIDLMLAEACCLEDIEELLYGAMV